MLAPRNPNLSITPPNNGGMKDNEYNLNVLNFDRLYSIIVFQCQPIVKSDLCKHRTGNKLKGPATELLL